MLLVLVCGCAQPPPARPAGTAAAPATPPSAASPADVERRWLQSWFKGTPVSISLSDDGSVAIEVPREFCFDGGRNTVKPALGAVLDKVAESLRRNPQSRLQLLAAPGDGDTDAALAMQRAEQLRSHLRARGVPEARLGSASRTSAAAVQLRLRFTAR